MPTEKDHLALASHNQVAIDFLLTGGEDFPDWVTTVAFYKAVHLIEALIARDYGIHGIDHTQRGRILKNEHRYTNIYRHYNALKEASSVARYLADSEGGRAYKQFTDYLTMTQVKSDILDSRLKGIEKSIAGLKPPKKK